MYKYSTEQLIKIIHSISRVSVKDIDLDVWFDNDINASGINGFIYGSFTRNILESIEYHLTESRKHSAEEIVKILHLIKCIVIENGKVNVEFYKPLPFTTDTLFIMDIIEIIGDHLSNEDIQKHAQEN
jgi:hypothetical protein